MPTYLYRCDSCGAERTETMTFAEYDHFDANIFGGHDAVLDQDDGVLAQCGEWQRVISAPYFNRPMPDHFNHSLGQRVSTDAQIQSGLSLQSDQWSERMGFDVNYELVDPTDPVAAGVTDEGLHETARVAQDMGLVLPKSRTFS